jgi:phosphatidate cytidylyltransferase
MSDKNQVLKQRSFTGLIFGVVVLTSIGFGIATFGMLLTAILVIGTSEYTTMVWPGSRSLRIISIILAVATALTMVFTAIPNNDFYKAAVLTTCILLLLGILNMKFVFLNHKRWWPMVVMAYIGMPLGLLASYAYHTQPYPLQLIAGMIACIWMSDSLAYIVGSRIGKNKLWPSISPKKTWEGFLGGGICSILLAALLSIWLQDYSTTFWQ